MRNFFIITRTDKNNDCLLEFFSRFANKYDKMSKTKACCVEEWTPHFDFACTFDTFCECKEWYKQLIKNANSYMYEITLARYSQEEDGCELPYVMLKTFLNSDYEA